MMIWSPSTMIESLNSNESPSSRSLWIVSMLAERTEFSFKLLWRSPLITPLTALSEISFRKLSAKDLNSFDVIFLFCDFKIQWSLKSVYEEISSKNKSKYLSNFSEDPDKSF
jgi:hypothetical protein